MLTVLTPLLAATGAVVDDARGCIRFSQADGGVATLDRDGAMIVHYLGAYGAAPCTTDRMAVETPS